MKITPPITTSKPPIPVTPTKKYYIEINEIQQTSLSNELNPQLFSGYISSRNLSRFQTDMSNSSMIESGTPRLGIILLIITFLFPVGFFIWHFISMMKIAASVADTTR
jgi:hypothetical protein